MALEDRVAIISDRYAGQDGLVDSNVWQNTVDCPEGACPWLPCGA